MTTAGCHWTAQLDGSSWITGLTPSGTGPGTVSLNIAPNAGIARAATLQLVSTDNTSGSTSVSVTQSEGCSYALPAGSASVAPAGTSATFALTSSDASCPWTAASDVSWITGVTPSGSGSASIAYSAGANPGPPRTGHIVAAGQTFTVNQGDGCAATLATPSAEVAASGGTASFGLNLSAPDCPWSAFAPAAWLSNVTPAGQGSGTVQFTSAENLGPARSANIEVAGRSFVVEQASGCRVELPVTSASALATGGSSSFLVNTAPGCAYTVSSNAAWLAPAGTATGVDYAVQASSDATRAATITVTSSSTGSTGSFTVTQASGCVLALGGAGANLSASGGNGRVDVTTGLGCTWTASADEPWVESVTVDAAGVSYAVPAHDGPSRTSLIRLTNLESGSSAEFALNQASGCSMTLDRPREDASAEGGPTSVGVTSAAGCALEASGGAAWLGNVAVNGGSVSFDVAGNTGNERTATLTVTSPDSGASAELLVVQGAGCELSVSPTVVSLGVDGGHATIDVASGSGCTFDVASSDGLDRGAFAAHGLLGGELRGEDPYYRGARLDSPSGVRA